MYYVLEDYQIATPEECARARKAAPAGVNIPIGAHVSRGEDGSCWVQAWVFVDEPNANL